MKSRESPVGTRRSYLLIGLSLVAFLCLLALFMDRGLSFHWGDKGMKITPKSAARLGVPVPQADRPDPDKMLSEENARLRHELEAWQEGSILLKHLPKGLPADPDETILRIRQLWEYRGTVWYCCHRISAEMAGRLSIDTGNPPDGRNMKTICECLQLCLKTIGSYRGEIDGNWRTTNDAVRRFQEEKGLVVDGKVGRRTWAAILAALAEQVNEEPPSEK